MPEKRNERIGGAMMASGHVYDMTGVGAPPPSVISAKRGVATQSDQREGMVELALDPSELDMDSDAMAVRYEQQMRENQSQLQKEDLSDMLAEHVAKQKVIIFINFTSSISIFDINRPLYLSLLSFNLIFL